MGHYFTFFDPKCVLHYQEILAYYAAFLRPAELRKKATEVYRDQSIANEFVLRSLDKYVSGCSKK